MNGAVDWRDSKYEETLNQELRGLERRRQADPACTPEELSGVLKHLYHMEGADWCGRGDLQDIILQATIAAYEQFIYAWKNETVSVQ